MTRTDLDAVVPAAGLSSRMSRFKPLAPLSGSTVLEEVVDTLRRAGVRDVIVVTGHRAEEVEIRAEAVGVRTVRNIRYREGMFTSVQAGVGAIAPDAAGFFLLPVDIPLIRTATIRRLAEAFLCGGRDVIHPLFRSMRGHPPVLSRSLIPAILTSDGCGGLRTVLDRFETSFPNRVGEVAVADEGVLQDMDTDEDYLRICSRRETLDMPSPDECEALFDLIGTPEAARRHGRVVARVAVAVARAVNARNPGVCELDLKRVERAALVHDLAKGHSRHEEEGGRVLIRHGFPAIAGIVAVHRSICPAPGSPVTEQEVVFLADKLVAGTELVEPAERYARVLKRWEHDPEARQAIEGRRKQALRVVKRVEAAMGRSLADAAAAAKNSLVSAGPNGG